jgi:hypothetical protein
MSFSWDEQGPNLWASLAGAYNIFSWAVQLPEEDNFCKKFSGVFCCCKPISQEPIKPLLCWFSHTGVSRVYLVFVHFYVLGFCMLLLSIFG